MQPSIESFPTLPRFVVSISPERYDAERLTIEESLRVVSSSAVQSRGWSFPYVERQCITSGPREAYIASEIAFGGFSYHLEQWRLHRSGQFVFRTMPWEVVNGEYQKRTWDEMKRRHPQRQYSKEPAGFLSFLSLIYLVTEAYIFASRLAQEVPFDTAVDMRVGLRGVKDRALGPSEASRPLYDLYMSRDDAVEYRKAVPLNALIASPVVEAVPAILSLFRQFGWIYPPSPDIIAQHQRGVLR